MRAVDELHHDGAIAPSTLRQLEERYGAPQLVELSMLIGHYYMLAGVIKSFGLQLEPEIEDALARAQIHAPLDTR